MYIAIANSACDLKIFSSILFLLFLPKFDVEKFFRENDLELWKFKMVDRDCGKGIVVVEELKSFNDDVQQWR